MNKSSNQCCQMGYGNWDRHKPWQSTQYQNVRSNGRRQKRQTGLEGGPSEFSNDRGCPPFAFMQTISIFFQESSALAKSSGKTGPGMKARILTTQ